MIIDMFEKRTPAVNTSIELLLKSETFETMLHNITQLV